MRDHCHEHGWIRGIVCNRCNKWLARIDRRFAPQVDEPLLIALLAVRNRCPDCERLEPADLGQTGRPTARSRGSAGTFTRWEVRSDELRRDLRPLLNSVERENAHVTVKRYDERTAVIVPAEWYDTVMAYIAATTFTAEAADFYARTRMNGKLAADTTGDPQ